MTRPVYDRHGIQLLHGDCLELLAGLADSSVDVVITDPPYGLEFMGKDWDRPWAVGMTAPGYTDGAQRLARPAHGDSRNANCRGCGGRQRGAKRCMCATPRWDRSPAEDMRAFQSWCERWAAECLRVLKPGGHLAAFGGTRTFHRLTAGIEDAGFEIRDSIGLAGWLYGSGFPKSLNIGDGRGTALKPAWEPIVLARKPLSGTVAQTVLTHGNGALNIDACRTGAEPRVNHAGGTSSLQRVSRVEQGYRDHVTESVGEASTVSGRWPTNAVFVHHPDCGPDDGAPCADDCHVAALDEQSGTSVSRAGKPRASAQPGDGWGMTATGTEHNDSGGASRFFPTFRYQAKAPRAERPQVDGRGHPTVKPLALIQWLVRLLTPPGGTVLDPFAGSGTTGQAARAEGHRALLIERDPTYLPLIAARLDARQRTDQPADPTTPVDDDGPRDLLDLLDGDAA